MTEGCGKDLWVEDLSVGEISVAENLLGVEVKREVVRSIIYSSLKVFLFIIITRYLEVSPLPEHMSYRLTTNDSVQAKKTHGRPPHF